MEKAIIGAIILLCLSLVGVCVDCGAGKTRFLECSVLNHHYVPSHTEITSSTDGDGKVTVSPQYYPEEFHLICSEIGTDNILDCEETEWTYQRITNGQPVTVKSREGKWTHSHYLPTIQNP